MKYISFNNFTWQSFWYLDTNLTNTRVKTKNISYNHTEPLICTSLLQQCFLYYITNTHWSCGQSSRDKADKARARHVPSRAHIDKDVYTATRPPLSLSPGRPRRVSAPSSSRSVAWWVYSYAIRYSVKCASTSSLIARTRPNSESARSLLHLQRVYSLGWSAAGSSLRGSAALESSHRILLIIVYFAVRRYPTIRIEMMTMKLIVGNYIHSIPLIRFVVCWSSLLQVASSRSRALRGRWEFHSWCSLRSSQRYRRP